MEHIELEITYKNKLDLKRFSLMLNNNSQCYKFYWLGALVNLLVQNGKKEITFEEAACEMIADAWYTVSEYHLHMGSIYEGDDSRNAIERAVKMLQEKSALSSTADKEKIMAAINAVKNDSDFRKIIKQMTDDVPFRLLSPFVPELTGNDRIWHSDKKIIDYYNMVNTRTPLPYTMQYIDAYNKTVYWNADWANMVKDNYLLILEWIRSKKIRYLQDRNPGVPGIVYKLDVVTARKLNHVHKLWDAIMDRADVIDIYSDTVLNGKRYDIDHFIPWSYVTTDELWNLTPAEKATNISKSNHLPDWELYFQGFVHNQLQLHQYIHTDTEIQNLFSKCRNDNLNTLWASDLYNTDSEESFRNILNDNMKPIYHSAKLQGYTLWNWE